MSDHRDEAAEDGRDKANGIAGTIEAAVDGALLVLQRFVRTYWGLLTAPRRPPAFISEDILTGPRGINPSTFLAIGAFLLGLADRAEPGDPWVWNWADRLMSETRRMFSSDVSIPRTVFGAIPVIASTFLGASVIARVVRPSATRDRITRLCVYGVAFSLVTRFVVSLVIATCALLGMAIPEHAGGIWNVLRWALFGVFNLAVYVGTAWALAQPALMVHSGLSSLRPHRTSRRSWLRAAIAGLLCAALAYGVGKLDLGIRAVGEALIPIAPKVSITNVMREAVLVERNNHFRLAVSIAISAKGDDALIETPLHFTFRLKDGNTPRTVPAWAVDATDRPTLLLIPAGETRVISVDIPFPDDLKPTDLEPDKIVCDIVLPADMPSLLGTPRWSEARWPQSGEAELTLVR